jgi:hypothetical protein
MFSDVHSRSPLESEYQNHALRPGKSYTPGFDHDRGMFEALDGETLDGGHGTLNVYAVHRKGDDRFLQLALVGVTTHYLVMKLSPDATPEAVLTALEEWAVDPDPSTRLLHVS